MSPDRPLIYLDRSTVREGRAEELRHRIGELAALAEAVEPELLSYAAYLDEATNEMSVLHVHPNQESLARHMTAVGPMFAAFRDLVTLRTIEVFGDPGVAVLEQLQAKATLLGGATLVVHDLAAGFVRRASLAAGG